MSTAYYPLGMRSMSASGYNQHSSQPQGYISWKGSGVFSNPVGVTASHIRPLTNNDPGNVFPTGFGLPRPMKHYRKGRVIPAEPIQANDLVAKNPYNQNIEIVINQTGLINYNMNRIVKSSKGPSLGGGSGGRGILNQMLDSPGSYLVKQNTPNEVSGKTELDKECKTCEGVGIVSSYYPNTAYLTENPERVTQTPKFCCNEERKARRRVVYASTNLKKNYYTTHTQYLQNRCQTYEQKAFNFMTPNPVNIATINSENPFKEFASAKPGSPLSLYNTYFANCFPNGDIYDATEDALLLKLLDIMESKGILTPEQVKKFEEIGKFNLDEFFLYIQTLEEPEKTEAINLFLSFINNPYIGVPLSGPSNRLGCKLTVYKPSNPQFAVQGAVDSSTRMLKLNVDTISTNAASFGQKRVATANEITQGVNNAIPFILKNKATPCNIPPIYPFQNHKSCSNLGKKFNTPNIPINNGSNIHYVRLQPPFSSNHFSQSPNTYTTTHI